MNEISHTSCYICILRKLTFDLQFYNEDVIAKHKSSSVEDLMELFNIEKKLAQTLNDSSSSFDDNDALKLAISQYLAAIDYDL